MSQNTARPLDSGRRDSLGRVVKVSGTDTANRSDAPPPPATDTDDGAPGEPCTECGTKTQRKSGLCRRCDPSSKLNKRKNNQPPKAPSRRATPATVPSNDEVVGAPTVTDTDSLYGPRVTGSNYDRDLDITDISTKVKGRFRELQKNGTIPATWKIKSRLDRFSGGQSIDLTIVVDDQPAYSVQPGFYINTSNEPRLLTIPHPNQPGETVDLHCRPGEQVSIRDDQAKMPAVWEHVDHIRQYLASFNRSQSNSMVDYSDTSFYGNVYVNTPNHEAPRPEFRPIP